LQTAGTYSKVNTSCMSKGKIIKSEKNTVWQLCQEKEKRPKEGNNNKQTKKENETDKRHNGRRETKN
jgi:hypothetical protein